MKDNMLEAYAELCFNMLKDICARAYAMFFSALFFFLVWRSLALYCQHGSYWLFWLYENKCIIDIEK
jgi:hypothetical protein